jgi:hypothetical protein
VAGRKAIWILANQPGRSGRLTLFVYNGSVRIEALYAPIAMNPIWPSEKTPVRPLDKFRPTTRIILIPMPITIRWIYALATRSMITNPMITNNNKATRVSPVEGR